jgi:putative heme-binding domain-containing protein
VFTHSRVGKPGTPDAQRTPLDAGVWRYHPTRGEFEVYAWGTSNPWGIDFDAEGQAFITACVIPHLFHVIQGGRYIRQSGSHFDTHAHAEIDTIADHRHWLGDTPHGGNLHSNAAGGGHAHCGALIYQGDGLPAIWRERLFVNNIHGNRTNTEILERAGSGYVGRHGEDLLLANDKWFRGIALRQGPAGAVYLIDWYDAQACHLTQPERWDRSNGRLYRVQGSADAAARLAEAKQTPLPADLGGAARIEACLADDTWLRTRARLALEADGADAADLASLQRVLSSDKDTVRRLRALWTLHALAPDDLQPLVVAREDADESLRAWSIQFACERTASRPLNAEWLGAFERLARTDASPRVRLYLASALQRLPLEARWPIASALVRRGEDARDANLPTLLWYGIEPLAAADSGRALGAFGSSPLESVARWTVRCASDSSAGRDAVCAELLTQLRRGDRHNAEAWLAEMLESVRGRSRIALPAAWPELRSALAELPGERVGDAAMALAAIFGDADAAQELLALALDKEQPLALRSAALDSALELPGTPPTDALIPLLDVSALRLGALRGLARSQQADVAPAVLSRWNDFDAEQRRAALSVLSSRAASARELLVAVGAGHIERRDVTAFALRQLQELGDPEVDALIAAHVGSVRRTSAEKQQRITELVHALPSELAQADRAHGRSLFARTCQQCHTLYGEGGTLAPDLSGANRKDLEYLLSNMIDPSAVVGQDYQAAVLELHDGRMLTGIVKQSTGDTLTLQNESQTLRIARDDIARQRASTVSTMPDGLLDALKPEEIRDLLGYLQGDAQAPLQMTSSSTAEFFDGQSLAHWKGDASIWRVEDRAIVGQSAGLAHNAFLVSDWELADFRLELDVLLVDDRGNSGIQFRTEPLPGGEVRGYQADVGPGWWGKLYEENGRGLLVDLPLPADFRPGDWNRYRIEAIGEHVRTWINDVPCVDLRDPAGARRGVVALQVHSGEPTEVRFRPVRLEILDRDR